MSLLRCGRLAHRRQNCDEWVAATTGEAAISAPTPTQAVEDLSFEGALQELEVIVARLEQGEVDLEDSIALYERGQALKQHCETKLKSAESRLEKIVMGAAGPEIGGAVETA
jgi:exodeoxyribonuclease VII small subunit